MKVILANDVKKIDESLVNEGVSSNILMENAAFSVTEAVLKAYSGGKVFFLCGPGGNGGDGFAAARQLTASSISVQCALIGDDTKINSDTKVNMRYFENKGTLLKVKIKEDLSSINIDKEDIIVDAIFGISLSREVRGIYKEVIEYINSLSSYKISVDMPSGVAADTGQVLGCAVKADETVTFVYPKPGQLIYPGREMAGKLTVANIGAFADTESDIEVFFSSGDELKLPKREKNTNKGDYGYLAILGGSKGFTGAAAFSAKSAMAAGAGVVCLGTLKEVQGIYAKLLPGAVTKEISGDGGKYSIKSIGDIEEFLKGKAAAAIGPGMGYDKGLLPLLKKILSLPLKKVLDADAINILSHNPDLLKNACGEIVLTPHPKEFSRLTGLSVDEIIKNPLFLAKQFALDYNVTLLLKGASTVVASKDKASIILAGTPGMAKGGSGDVLTGVIAGLMSQGFGAHFSAVLGAHICGKAGEAASEKKGEYSMTPKDTINNIPYIIKKMSR
ncbi:MAG: NAD(P)H-hydrate dehydratase [Eubacteriales bacterium]